MFATKYEEVCLMAIKLFQSLSGVLDVCNSIVMDMGV